jgi:hypothetical protein
MKPSFPYSFFKYDLAVIPAHDEGPLPEPVFRTLISPSGYTESHFQEEAGLLAAEIQGSEKTDVAVFIGGKAHDYDFTVADAEKIASVLDRATAKTGGYVLTTSRRTAVGVERFFKHNLGLNSACRKLIVANEDSRAFIAKGMLGLARRVIVTEDSLAMVSEAAASGKPVIVLRTYSRGLPEKHRRFLETLIERGWVRAAAPGDLAKILSEDFSASPAAAIESEKEALREVLRGLL